MTVGELMTLLARMPADAPVVGLWDDCVWPIHRVEHIGRRVIIDVSQRDSDVEYVRGLLERGDA